MASDPSSTSSTPAGSPNSSWSADPDVLKTLVGLLSSSVDPFANHSEVYRQLQQLQAHLQGDFELYLVFLMAQWNNPGLRVEVCQAAGLLLKQSVKSKYKDGVSESAKGFVKGALLWMRRYAWHEILLNILKPVCWRTETLHTGRSVWIWMPHWLLSLMVHRVYWRTLRWWARRVLLQCDRGEHR